MKLDHLFSQLSTIVILRQVNNIKESTSDNIKFICNGILVFARHCSIMVDAKELFGAESKSQVYAPVHNLLKKIKDTGTRIFVMNN